jgi:hypothetical protein
MQIHAGETWGKRQATGSVVIYLVLKIDRKGRLTLQNLKTPTSVFETDADKLAAAGYFRVSETPYVDLASSRRKRAHRCKLTRCPRTVDLFEGRADSEFPRIPDQV